jgi:hypothetical protein
VPRPTAAALGAALLFTPLLAHAGDDHVKVRVTGANRGSALVLERQIEGTDLWESVCTGACDQRLPRDGMYRVRGRGIRPSLPVALLPARDQTVRLEVTPGYSAGWVGGIVLTVLGPLVMTGGTIATGAGAGQSSVAPCPFGVTCFAEPQSRALLIGGVISLLVGGVMTAAGIVTTLVTDHSRVRQVGALSARGLTLTF